MSDKKIYDLLNNVKVDIGDDIEEVSEFEKEKFKRNFKNNINKDKNINKNKSIKKGLVVASIILLSGIGSQTQLGQNVYAIAESKINNISYSIGKSLNIEKNIDQYSNVLNKLVESNDIGIKITDIIIDKDEILISNLIDINNLKNKDDITSVFFDEKVFINGKRLKNMGSSGNIGVLENEKNIYSDIRNIDAKGIDLDKDLNVKIIYDNFYYYDSEFNKNKIKGKWEYEFIANGTELKKSTIVKKLDYKFNIEETEVILDDIRLNPINKTIYGKINNNKNYDISLRGYDNFNNEVTFNLIRSLDGEIILRQDDLNNKLSEDVDYIRLTPYAMETPKESGKIEENFKKVGKEFIINLK